jgi:beta propeller repeat protein
MDNRNDSVMDSKPEWDIYLYQISTKQETLITTAAGIHTNPKINDGKVVWEDGRNFQGEDYLRGGSNVPENNTDIYMYDIESGEETAIATGSLQECNPFVCGDYVVWEDRNDGDFAADIYLYNIASKEKTRITNDKVDQRTPRIYGNYIVWMDERNGISSNDVIINGKAPNSDIFLYDIESEEEYLLTGKEPQVMPDISGNYITFITSRQINPEISVIKYREGNQQIDVNYKTEGKIKIY